MLLKNVIKNVLNNTFSKNHGHFGKLPRVEFYFRKIGARFNWTTNTIIIIYLEMEIKPKFSVNFEKRFTFSTQVEKKIFFDPKVNNTKLKFVIYMTQNYMKKRCYI